MKDKSKYPLYDIYYIIRIVKDNIDHLEAEKESLVNQVYNIKELIKIVNEQGTHKMGYIKEKHVIVILSDR